MYKLDLPIDLKEASAIERRKRLEQERQSRIFNAKTRTIGIDLQGISQQAKDKKEREELERKRSEAYAADLNRNDKIACLMEQRQHADMRALEAALNEFRALHQQPAARREWDLYEPDARRKDKPARVCDDDPRCTISGLQRFDGEDLNSRARQAHQREQLGNWCEQQNKEREAAAKAQKEADRLYDLKRREMDLRACELAAAEDECRHAIDRATADYNAALRREAEERARLARQQCADDDATEVANALNSDMLTENPAVAASAFGAHRVVPDRWKGMSPEELARIKRTQEKQMRDNERLQQEEALRKKEWDRQQALQARTGLLMEREVERKRKELVKKQAEDNLKLAKEQRELNEFMSKEVYTNPPTAAYFMQFNTTSR